MQGEKGDNKWKETPMPLNVNLVAETNLSPEVLSSHAAKTCYEPDVPEIGKLIDVKSRLFDTGHHTTVQHNYFTFGIDGISVSSVCLGLHLASPYYNTDQRSGRFSKMYDEPNIEEIKNHLERYFPGQDTKSALNFIQNGLDLYSNNKEKVTNIAADLIKKERPFASEKYINANASKFAQEQLRMFISMVAPTALDYTLNLSALTALYRVAWNPEMREVVQCMVNSVLEKHPEIEYMFNKDVKSNKNWHPEYININPSKVDIKTRPEFNLLDVKYDEKTFNPNNNSKDTVDVLYFSPLTMNNSRQYVASEIEVSCGATMGQDQRHRSIKRDEPVFTGNFYLPPLLKQAGLEKEALNFTREFLSLANKIDLTMLTNIAPYGAMVKYKKTADLNALLHEQGKRTCWCAQEEIYHISTDLRSALSNKIGKDSKLVQALAPHCFKDGKCCEGTRYCGREIKERLIGDYFKDRQI